MRAGETKTQEFRDKEHQFNDFYSESHGKRRKGTQGETEYLSRHGEIVDALKAWRESSGLPHGGRLVKNVLIDMGVRDGEELVEVYEVKTSTRRSDIYTAMGQLLVHGSSENCRRFVVLPEKEPLAHDLIEALRRLGIKDLRFKLSKSKATII